MAFALKSRELVSWEGAEWIEESDPLIFDTTLEAAKYARKHSWGGRTWDIAAVCPMTGIQGPWEYFMAEWMM